MSSAQATASITPKASLSASAAKASATAKSSGATVHTVSVGNGGFIFDPDTIYAKPGDTVSFEFYPPDHSVARAEYQKPCVPYEDTGKDKVGFWSKTQFVTSTKDLTYFNVTVNDTKPVFFYCAAKGSCKDQLMVGAINPNEEQTLAVQKAFAKNSTYQIAPGEQIPSEASAALSAPVGTVPTAAASSTSSSDHHAHGLSGGAIAGIVVGAVAFLVVCAALFFYIGRTRSMKQMIKRNDATVAKNTGQEGYGGTPMTGTPMTGHFSQSFSPQMQQAEYGNLPPYGQHNATDTHPSGWGSPAPSHTSPYNLPPAQNDAKHHSQMSELASPTPNQQTFTAELEAPLKSPRG